jgi:hypothetical protein
MAGRPPPAIALLAALGWLMCAAPAGAQDAAPGSDTAGTAPPPQPVTVLPLGPPGGTAPSGTAPNGTFPNGAAPGTAAPPGTLPAQPGQPQTYAPAVMPPLTWVPRATAQVQALDKANAITKTLSVKVGQSATFGSLTIAVQSCMVRPPNEPQNAAAFLVITDQHPDQPGFSGWMVADDPSLSMLQNPIYDVRVTGCQA